ncbi:MAG: hypothetical protein ABWX65_00070 [Mycetocola sp.]
MRRSADARPAAVRSRRWVVRGAIAGAVLLGAGVGVMAVEAQLRIDAATAAATLSPEEEAQLAEAGIDDIGQESAVGWLITSSMYLGTPVPDLTLYVEEMEDGNSSVSWGPSESPIVVRMGGWQPQPIAMLAVAGLGMLIGSGFVAAARWAPRDPA